MRNEMLLTIGGEDASDLLAHLEQAGVQLNSYALTYLTDGTFAVLPEKSTVRLCICTAEELGLPRGGSLQTIYAAAKERGPGLCPAETAVYLRLTMMDQSASRNSILTGMHTAPDGALMVASEPLYADDDFPKGLYLRNVGGVLWLRGYTCTEEYLWPGDSEFVFAVGCEERDK